MGKEDWRYGPMSCRCLTGAEIAADNEIRKARAKSKDIFLEQQNDGMR